MVPTYVTLKLSSGSGGVLVLDVVGPHLVGHVTLVRFHPANLSKRRDPIRLKAWGFPIPYRGL
jgi:hypothetical protein